MAIRTQIEVSKDNLKKIEALQSKCRLRLSLTTIANEAIGEGLLKVKENLDNAGVLTAAKK